jgi:hypothetical protein
MEEGRHHGTAQSVAECEDQRKGGGGGEAVAGRRGELGLRAREELLFYAH